MKPERDIWFVSDEASDGYRPATRQGWLTYGLAVAWILLCSTGGMVGFLLKWSP